MRCPDCGGPMWNNAPEVCRRRIAGEKPCPQFRCKDASCGGVVWPDAKPKPRKRDPFGERAQQSARAQLMGAARKRERRR